MKIASTGTEESASRRCANVGYAGSSSNAAACARVCHTVPTKRIQKYIKCFEYAFLRARVDGKEGTHAGTRNIRSVAPQTRPSIAL